MRGVGLSVNILQFLIQMAKDWRVNRYI